MENTDKISLPAEFSAAPKRKFNPIENLRKNKKPIDLTETRERLLRVNRTVKCIHCEEDRILNPDQYQSYFDYWGDEDKILRNFVCKPCEVFMNNDPFKFWVLYGEQYKKLCKHLKAAFEGFRHSSKTPDAELLMTKTIVEVLTDAKLSVNPNLLQNNHLEFIITSGNVLGLKIKNIPFVGTVTITPYDTTKIAVS